MPLDSPDPPKYILSFGGGVNTVALMVILVQEEQLLDEVIFSDTGGEVPETYAYIEIAQDFLNRYGIPFRTVSKRIEGRDLYDTCWKREVFPSVTWRWSTRDFKVKPIHTYYKSLGVHINQYMGIAYDEIDRMKDSLVPFVTNLYPLIDKKITRAGCIQIIEEAGLPVPVKSGCYFCPFNSMGRWEWLYETHPDLFKKALLLEEHSKHFPSQRLTDQVYRKRAVVTLREFREAIRQGGAVDLKEAENPCGGECMT